MVTRPSESVAVVPSPRLSVHWSNASSLGSPLADTLMFSVRWRTRKCCHRWDLLTHASTNPALEAPGTTGRICLKSPDNTTTFPPNGVSDFPVKSLKVLSKASRWNRWIIVASSMYNNFALLTRSAVALCAEIDSVESSVGVNGAFILEWNVLPKCSRLAAIPVLAIARAIDPPGSKDRTASNTAFIMNVFPAPPLAERNAWSGVSDTTACIMVSKTRLWSRVNLSLALSTLAFNSATSKSSSSLMTAGSSCVKQDTAANSSPVGLSRPKWPRIGRNESSLCSMSIKTNVFSWSDWRLIPWRNAFCLKSSVHVSQNWSNRARGLLASQNINIVTKSSLSCGQPAVLLCSSSAVCHSRSSPRRPISRQTSLNVSHTLPPGSVSISWKLSLPRQWSLWRSILKKNASPASGCRLCTRPRLNWSFALSIQTISPSLFLA